MKRKLLTRIIAGIATSAVLAVGSLSFTAINAIADEAVSYYGLSADGTVISGTVTDYTKIASTDTAWGTAGKETWYVAECHTQERCSGKCSERHCRHRCNNNFL